MKKRISLLTLVLLFLVSISVIPASAASSGKIYSIDVSAVLTHGGNAMITEEWTVEVPDNWTEMYLVKANMEDMEIQDLTVEDLTTGTKYKNVGEWDIDWSRSEKAGKCGSFIDDDGAEELCWGVGSSGRHEYRVSYTMTNAVNAYTDGYDGFNIRFINSDLSSEPNSATVTVSALDAEGKPMPFTKENTRFWAFGLDAETALNDQGAVVIKTIEDGSGINYCNVLMRFEDGMFEPVSSVDDSFENLRERAFNGSEFSEDEYQEFNDRFYKLKRMFSQAFVVLLFFLAFAIGYSKRNKKHSANQLSVGMTKSEASKSDYWRDIPFSGNLPEAYLVLRALSANTTDSRIMGAYLMRWLRNGYIRMEQTEAKKLFRSDGMENSIIFCQEKVPAELSGAEASLWNILKDAAGGDGILQEKELKNWSERHYNRISGWYNSVASEGMSFGRQNGTITDIEQKVLFVTTKKAALTDLGQDETRHLYGLKKYLKDFTLLNERTVPDATLWGEYLTYASLFGIAEEVAKQFKKLIPDYFDNPEKYGYAGPYGGPDVVSTMVMINMINNMSAASHTGYSTGLQNATAAQHTSSSGGGGGFSSFGGGGGFSGGGAGGGGR